MDDEAILNMTEADMAAEINIQESKAATFSAMCPVELINRLFTGHFTDVYGPQLAKYICVGETTLDGTGALPTAANARFLRALQDEVPNKFLSEVHERLFGRAEDKTDNHKRVMGKFWQNVVPLRGTLSNSTTACSLAPSEQGLCVMLSRPFAKEEDQVNWTFAQLVERASFLLSDRRQKSVSASVRSRAKAKEALEDKLQKAIERAAIAEADVLRIDGRLEATQKWLREKEVEAARVTQLEEMVVAMYEYLDDFRTRTAALSIPNTTPVTSEVSYRYEHLRGAIKEVVASAKRLPTQATPAQPQPNFGP